MIREKFLSSLIEHATTVNPIHTHEYYAQLMYEYFSLSTFLSFVDNGDILNNYDVTELFNTIVHIVESNSKVLTYNHIKSVLLAFNIDLVNGIDNNIPSALKQIKVPYSTDISVVKKINRNNEKYMYVDDPDSNDIETLSLFKIDNNYVIKGCKVLFDGNEIYDLNSENQRIYLNTWYIAPYPENPKIFHMDIMDKIRLPYRIYKTKDCYFVYEVPKNVNISQLDKLRITNQSLFNSIIKDYKKIMI